MLLKEVMEKSGLSRKAVQYYEDQGFVKPVKLENGYRDYDEDCLKTLRDIHAMRQMGLHIKEIRAILIEEEYAPQVYEQLIHELDMQMVRLQSQRMVLRKRIYPKALPIAGSNPVHAGRYRLSSVSLATGYNQSVADCSTACFHFAAYTKYVLRYENSRSAVYGNRLETARTDRCACFYLWYPDSDFLQGSIYAAIWCCLLYHCCN